MFEKLNDRQFEIHVHMRTGDLLDLLALKVNRQQPRSAQLRPIQKIPTPIKLFISPLPEMINQICKKYGLENSQDKKTSDDTCDIFEK